MNKSYADVLESYLIAEEGLFSKIRDKFKKKKSNNQNTRRYSEHDKEAKIPIQCFDYSPTQIPSFKKLVDGIKKDNFIPKYELELHHPEIGDNVTEYGRHLSTIFKKISSMKEWRQFIDELNTHTEKEMEDYESGSYNTHYKLDYHCCDRWESDYKKYHTSKYINVIDSTISCDINQDEFFIIGSYLETILTIIINKSLGSKYHYSGCADDTALFGIGKRI